jgi:transcriptional regulator with XRE-family HTH domain
VVRFLGYDPSPAPVSLPERIRATRRRQGISQEELARRLGIDPSTVTAWESGAVRRPYRRFVEMFEKWVGSAGAVHELYPRSEIQRFRDKH